MVRTPARLLLGIDGGGSGCRAAVSSADGRVTGRGAAGSANIWSDTRGAVRHIVEAARAALRDAGLPDHPLDEIRAVIGVAGADIAEAVAMLTRELPFRDLFVCSDGEVALRGALGYADGAIAVIGTGTIYLRRRGDSVLRVGGYGFEASDFGGGARMGRRLLVEALLAHDRIRAGTQLTGMVIERFGGPVGIAEFARRATPRELAALAPEILHYRSLGDRTAHTIVHESVTQIVEALAALDLQPQEPLCFLGGLATSMVPMLPDRYRKTMMTPKQDAVGGALSLAMERKWSRETTPS